jgi:hypothetical protein
MFGVGTVIAAGPEACDKYLSVELTPDVPNPRDLAFLSSPLTVPGYQFVWRQQNGGPRTAATAIPLRNERGPPAWIIAPADLLTPNS